MVFIPVVPHRPVEHSPRALDLARRLKDEVEKFERQYPGTSREDLRTAAAIAIGDDSPAKVPPRRAIAAAITGIVAALGGLGLVMELSQREGGAPELPVIAVAVMVACVGIIAAAVLRSRRQG
jgi:hypothetical protein